MQSFRKTNEQSLEIFKEGQTDGQTDRQGRLLWTPTGKPGVQNGQNRKIAFFDILCIFLNFAKIVETLVKILKKWSNFRQICQTLKKYIKYQKSLAHSLDNIIVHKLAKFQLSISF